MKRVYMIVNPKNEIQVNTFYTNKKEAEFACNILTSNYGEAVRVITLTK